MNPDWVRQVLAHYPHAGPVQRFHLAGRLRLCPYPSLLKHLTGTESILDIGCGFGHLAWFLAREKPGLRYYGTDLDEAKIALARACPPGAAASAGEEPSTGNPPAAAPPVFLAGDVREHAGLPARFGNIVLLDVLYLMPWEAQLALLEWCLSRLSDKPGSALVIKAMPPPEGFSGFRAVAQEWLMVRVLRRTRHSGLVNGARPWTDYRDFAAARGLGFEREELNTFNPSMILGLRRVAAAEGAPGLAHARP
jgi:SAM-dependent methyltransferase